MAEIRELIKQLAGTNNYNDISLYQCEVLKVDIPSRTFSATTINGPEVTIPNVSMMTTIGDGSFKIPVLGSIVYVMTNPLTPPFVVHYGDISNSVIQSPNVEITSDKVKVTATETITFNSDEFGGMIKIQELTDKINILENALNNLITLFNAHFHTSAAPASPTSPPLTLDTDVIQITLKTDIENPDIVHGTKI